MNRADIAVAALASLLAPSLGAQTLSTLTPVSQRVHEYLTLEGSGFGAGQGGGQVVFTDGVEQWPAGRAYLWRDDLIRVRVPAGKRDGGGAIVALPTGPLSVFVQTASGVSSSRPFRLIVAAAGSLEFQQLTAVGASHADSSSVLGSPNLNSARTKDAEVSDVNGDGWPDLIDNNSNNVQNASHSALRLNNQDRTFTAIPFEPLDPADSGSFAAEVAAGGDFFQDHTTYDADFVDIDNDRLPDLVQTAADNFSTTPGAHRVRILVNDRGGIAGRFSEETAARMPASPFGATGCPDDVDHIDLDDDGDVDFLVTMRTSPDFCSGSTSEIRVFSNDGSGVFGPPTTIDVRAGNSTHDAFFVDADNDGAYDIVTANEWDNAGADGIGARCQLLLNDGAGGFSENRTFDLAASAGDVADFNRDGLMDFVLGRTEVRVFLTRPDSPCLADPGSECSYDEILVMADDGQNNPFYDLEMGDLNLDGAVDIVGARIGAWANNVAIWINDGTGTSFTDITGGDASTVLPGNGEYQRLSADLLDFDLDGDLDLYVTGQDGADDAPVGDGSGRGPNQLFENLLVGLDIASPRQPRPAYAGSATGGRKVLVRLRATLPVAGLSPADFTISVDGAPLDPTATVTGAAIEEELWLLVQMPALPDGCYDLGVALTATPAMSATEALALCYDEERLFDRVLAIDRTRSMLDPTPEKMESARSAADFFVNLSEDADEIGVTSFKRFATDFDGLVEQHELARTDFGIQPAFDVAASDDRRDDAIAVIDGIAPDGISFDQETSIGAGLRQAWDELTAGADPDHEWEIVLLSDGLENFAPFWERLEVPLVMPLKPEILGADPPVRIHTVAVGENAALEVLMDIADGTGGGFFNLYEGTASFGLMSRLAAVYKYIDEEIRDEQRFFYREGLPEPVIAGSKGFEALPDGVPLGRRLVMADFFYVPEDFESLTVGFHWNIDQAVGPIVLFDPSITPIAVSPPTRTVESHPKHLIYRIRDPQPGRYYYSILQRGTNDPFEFFVTASGISDLIATGRRGRIVAISKGEWRVVLRMVVGDFDPVLGASVTGDVILPDKTRVPITLHDDGAHDDGEADDGIYAQAFAHTMPGGYMAELVTTGVSNREEPFERRTLLSWGFPGAKADPNEPAPRAGRGPLGHTGRSAAVGPRDR